MNSMWRDKSPLVCCTFGVHVTSLVRVCGVCDLSQGVMTHPYVRLDEFVFQNLWHGSFRYAAGLTRLCAGKNPSMGHDVFLCDMTHSYWCRDWFVPMTWLVRVCDMTYSCVFRDSSEWVSWLIYVCEAMNSIWRGASPLVCCTFGVHVVRVCGVTVVYGYHDAFVCVTRRIIPCDEWHGAFRCAPGLQQICVGETKRFACKTQANKNASFFQCFTIFFQCFMTHFCATWSIRTYCMPHSYRWREPFLFLVVITHFFFWNLRRNTRGG